MESSELIGVCSITVGSKKVPVLLFRNATGSVSGHCLLGENERTVIDGETPESTLATIRDVIELSLLARGGRS